MCGGDKGCIRLVVWRAARVLLFCYFSVWWSPVDLKCLLPKRQVDYCVSRNISLKISVSDIALGSKNCKIEFPITETVLKHVCVAENMGTIIRETFFLYQSALNYKLKHFCLCILVLKHVCVIRDFYDSKPCYLFIMGCGVDTYDGQ